jgi:hypothetical protein
MDEQVLEILLMLVSTVATMGIVYLKKTLGATEGKKSEAEEQADAILDFVGKRLGELRAAYPRDARIVTMDKQFRKIRVMWDTETVSTADLGEYIKAISG